MTWTGRCASRGLVLLALGLALVLGAIGVGIVIAFAGTGSATWVGWFVAVVGVAVGVLTALMSSLEVRLEPTTFTVAFGPFGWPRRTIALRDVADVAAIVVDPLEWGGLGYRWMPGAKATAAVIRKGPGIVLALRDGRRFAVTVDEAVEGAKATSAALSALPPDRSP